MGHHMSLLDRDGILNAEDMVYDDVIVPEWKGTVRVRSMNGAENDWLDTEADRLFKEEKFGEMHVIKAKLAVRTMVDADGNRLMQDEDVDRLIADDRNARPIDRIYKRVIELSGRSDDAVDEAKKNSANGHLKSSGTDSYSPSEVVPSVS